MNFLGIIPARYASTRFPGKPLALIHGKPMIRCVYEQALKALPDLWVATDDGRIEEAVKQFGGNVILTGSHHRSGTDRCAEALKLIHNHTKKIFDVVINIQGDEPFIQPEQLRLLLSCFDQPGTRLATLAKKITTQEELINPNIPKIVLNHHSEAIYFSRSVIPYIRQADMSNWLNLHTFYKHIGTYAYLASTLNEITTLAPSALEKAESLEQLRWIENGYPIQVAITTMETISIDTPEDLIRAEHYRP